jgi:hypothetical protein
MKLWEVENNRNTINEALFRAMVSEAYPDVNLVVAGHHIFFRRDGSDAPEEIPSADALIFDHFIAQAVWKSNWQNVLAQLALEPAATRDALLARLFNARHAA